MSIIQMPGGIWHWKKTEGAVSRYSRERFLTAGDAWSSCFRIAHATGATTELDVFTWGQILLQWETEGAQIYAEGLPLDVCANRYQRAAWLRRSLHVGEAQTMAFREWASAELRAVAV